MSITVGDTVKVYDRYRFAVPLAAVVVMFAAVNDGVKVTLLESNNPNYPIGSEVWVHEQQLVKEHPV